MTRHSFQLPLQLSGISTLLTLVGVLGITGDSQAFPRLTPLQAQVTTAASKPDVVALAKHLQQVGAKMYGAYWCPYCHRQRDLFGQTAFSQYIQYIECDPRGENPKPSLCREAKVKGYPTWEINGQFYPGLKSLDELATLSNYRGDRKF